MQAMNGYDSYEYFRWNATLVVRNFDIAWEKNISVLISQDTYTIIGRAYFFNKYFNKY